MKSLIEFEVETIEANKIIDIQKYLSHNPSLTIE